jgi:hypothetical protein
MTGNAQRKMRLPAGWDWQGGHWQIVSLPVRRAWPCL